MDWVFSEHAATVMRERQIVEVWVASALRCAEVIVDDAVDPQLKHALKRIPEADNKVLRVVYNARTSPVVVVTTFFDRRERRRRESHLR